MTHRQNRRRIVLGAAATILSPGVFSQTTHGAHHEGQYESLNKPGRIGLPELASTQHVFDSPAPKAAQPGRWMARAALPLPRSEMAWAVTYEGKMHLVGGYGEQRVDRPYHQVYDAQTDRWSEAASGSWRPGSWSRAIIPAHLPPMVEARAVESSSGRPERPRT